MSNLKRKTTNGYESIPINADKLGGMTLEQIQALINGLVTLATKQTITGEKTFNAPANSNGSEQATIIIKTANGGQIIFGKEGPNSGSMIGLDQVAGTRRLNFRASATPGAIVWSQPESNSSLYYDVTNVYFRECTSVVFSNFANASALGTDSSGKIKKVSLATVATSGSYSDLKNKPTIPSKLSQMTNDANYLKSTDNIDAKTLESHSYSDIYNQISAKQDRLRVLESVDQYLKTGKGGILSVSTGTLTPPSGGAPLTTVYTKTYTADEIVKGAGANAKATSDSYGLIKTGYSENGKNYPVELNSDGQAYVNVPWTSSGYTLPDATAYTVGGVKMKVQYISDTSDVYEVGIDIVSDAYSTRPLYIRAGRFKQTSGSASSTSNFTFKKSMDTINDRSADRVVVILGDSKGQSTNGGYMGSLAVDSSNYSGFSYRASNTEKGYVMYIALGSW